MDAGVDVIVCGSGAAGLFAALRASDLGLRVLVIEKTSRYGGTSATSGGGVWIPNHGGGSHADSREAALQYLDYVSDDGRLEKLQAYVDAGPEALKYANSLGVGFESAPGFPDYYSGAPGATTERSLFPMEMDGADLGEEFYRLRDAPSAFKLFNKYALNLEQSFALSARPFGWQWVAAKVIANYWMDLSWRRKTSTDRRLTQGRALVGRLRKAMLERRICLRLNTGVTKLLERKGQVCGVEVEAMGQRSQIEAHSAVALATGGFEQSQVLRDKYMPVPTNSAWSLTPKAANAGDALLAGLEIGADTEFLEHAWWAPSMRLPSRSIPNVDETHPMFFDYYHPHSLCVNRLGRRFVNESCPYDQFGQAMISDHKKTGSNVPCWLIFDSNFRKKYACGAILPSFVMSDDSLPLEWWDSYIFRGRSIEELAGKIRVDRDQLSKTVTMFNEHATSGNDPDFGRGTNGFDVHFGDPEVKPNPCLGRVSDAPFYAVQIDLGDLGTKGGLKTDRHARVLSKDGIAIEGLYAVGNCSGSPFGNCYPGGGGTLGPAIVFSYLAANHIAERARLNR